MNKIKDFMSRPITWGGYFKLCGISLGISMAYYVAFLVKMGYIDPKELVKKLKKEETKD